MSLSPRAATVLVATQTITLAVLAGIVLSGFVQTSTRFGEISAERLNIVGADGKTVLVIANKARIAGPVVAGKPYPVSVSDGREHMAGLIFFNQDGDEMGGLVFNSFRLPNGKAAGIGHLSFDRFADNQVVALQYKENATTVQAGLTVYDRPGTGVFGRSLDLVQEAQTAPPARVAEIKRELTAMAADAGLGAERAFLGSRDRTSQLVLKDSRGRVRARLSVGTDDTASLEFLDEAGKVSARFPGR
jgi:hypothetical protein